MKFKLDENLGERGRVALAEAGHDVATVPDQQMTSATDDALYQACAAEGRALVTLDLDFSNPLRYPPEDAAGIAVLRLPKSPSVDDLDHLMRVLIKAIDTPEVLEGKLWIIEADRIRIYKPSDE